MRIAVKAKMRKDKQKIRNRSFNELDSLRSIKLKKVSSLSDFYARKQKKENAQSVFQTSEDADKLPFSWVWHPMGREGLEPATR